jgi:hypothetical protein
MMRRGVRPPPPPQHGGPTPSFPGHGGSGRASSRTGSSRTSWPPPPHAPPSSLGAAVVVGRCPALDPVAALRLPLRPSCSGPGSGRGAAAPSLLVPGAEAEAGDLAAVRRLPPYSRGGPSSRRSCRGEAAADRAVRSACGGGGVAGVGTEDRRPTAAWSCLGGGGPRPTLLFFIFLCREYLGGAQQRACDAFSHGTAVNPFSLSCVTYSAWQRTVSCVSFPQGARQRYLPGKNAPCALCRALGQKAHDKGGAVRIMVFAVRRRRTTKRTNPVVSVRE